MPTHPPPMLTHKGIFKGLWFCLQDDVQDWTAIMHLIRSQGGKTVKDPWHSQLTHMVVELPSRTGCDYTHAITQYINLPPWQETCAERCAWPLDRVVDVFTQGRYPRGVAVVQVAWITECLASRRLLGTNEGYGGWLVRGVRQHRGFERERERYTTEVQMASYFDDDGVEDDGGYCGPSAPRRIETKREGDDGGYYRDRERDRNHDRDHRESPLEHPRRDKVDDPYYRDATRDPRLRSSSDYISGLKHARGSWSPELSSPNRKRRATTGGQSSRDDGCFNVGAQYHSQDNNYGPAPPRRQTVPDPRDMRPTSGQYNRGELPQTKLICPASDRHARSVSRYRSRPPSIERSLSPREASPPPPTDPRSAYGTVGRGRPSAPPSWLPTFISTAPRSRQDSMVVNSSRSVSAYQPRPGTAATAAVPSHSFSAYQPCSTTMVVVRKKETPKPHPQPHPQPTRTFTRAPTVEVKREPQDVPMREDPSPVRVSSPLPALDELRRLLMQEHNGGYRSGDVPMPSVGPHISLEDASPLFTPDPSPPPEERSSQSRATTFTMLADERPAAASAPIVIDKTNESAPKGIFSAGRRFPVTFWVWPSHQMIETMIGMGGGFLVERSQAEFVVLPVDQGEAAKDTEMAELVRGVGVHPLGRVVSRDWVWRSVNKGALQSLAPFLLTPSGSTKATSNGSGATKGTTNGSNASGKGKPAATREPTPAPRPQPPPVLAPPEPRASVTATTILGEYNFVDDAELGSDPDGDWDDHDEYINTAAKDDDDDDDDDYGSAYTPTTSTAVSGTRGRKKKSFSTRPGPNLGDLTPPAELMPLIDSLVDWMSRWDQIGPKMARVYAFGHANGYKEKKMKDIYLDYKQHINARVPFLSRHSRAPHTRRGTGTMTR